MKKETTTIQSARKKIDQIDRGIIKAIRERNNLAKIIGQLKIKQQLRITDAVRERQLEASHRALAKKLKVDATMVRKIFLLIINQSKMVQSNEH